MIDIDIEDFPKLTPDESIHFEAKDEIRRSPEMNFECSELEYKYIVAEETLVEKYNIRLAPDAKIMMPNKNSLKHKTSKPYLLWLSLAVAVAVFALVLIVIKNKTTDLPTVATDSKPKTETNVITETKPETKTETETKPETVPVKTVENKANIPVKKSGATAKKSVPKTIAPQTTESNIPVETSENKNEIPRPEDVRIERIATAFAPVEMMNKDKTVFIYQPDYQQTVAFKTINDMASITEKFSLTVGNAKQNVVQILEGFKLPDILSRLSIDRGIDKEIDEWAKNNPDIPFSVFIDYSSENKMTEIYDETGTLVKVIFFTNKSLKYRNNKTYQASNKRIEN